MLRIGSFLSLFLLLLTACGLTERSNSEDTTAPEPTAPTISGFVMDQQNDEILVVTSDMLEAERLNAMWISGIEEGLWMGKQVDVWIDGAIQESFPARGEASDIETVEMSEVTGADLTASEALSAVLSSIDGNDILSVQMMTYNEEQDQWMVQLMEVGSENVFKEVVKDEK